MKTIIFTALFLALPFVSFAEHGQLDGKVKYQSICQEQGEDAIRGRGEIEKGRGDLALNVDTRRLPYVTAYFRLVSDDVDAKAISTKLSGVAYGTKDNLRKGVFGMQGDGVSVRGKYRMDKNGNLKAVKGSFTIHGNCVTKGKFRATHTPLPVE